MIKIIFCLIRMFIILFFNNSSLIIFFFFFFFILLNLIILIFINYGFYWSDVYSWIGGDIFSIILVFLSI